MHEAPDVVSEKKPLAWLPFAWMTLHSFEPDHPVSYPFTDAKSLEMESY